MIDAEPAIDVVGPSLRERLAAVWRSNRWWVIAVVALVTFVLGFLGFRELDKDIGFLDGVYLTLQLFTFQAAFVGEADAGAMLNIARFLAPVTTATALFTATAAAFREQLNDWRLGRIRDHVVVCGAGVAGARDRRRS